MLLSPVDTECERADSPTLTSSTVPDGDVTFSRWDATPVSSATLHAMGSGSSTTVSPSCAGVVKNACGGSATVNDEYWLQAPHDGSEPLVRTRRRYAPLSGSFRRAVEAGPLMSVTATAPPGLTSSTCAAVCAVPSGWLRTHVTDAVEPVG